MICNLARLLLYRSAHTCWWWFSQVHLRSSPRLLLFLLIPMETLSNLRFLKTACYEPFNIQDFALSCSSVITCSYQQASAISMPLPGCTVNPNKSRLSKIPAAIAVLLLLFIREQTGCFFGHHSYCFNWSWRCPQTADLKSLKSETHAQKHK